MAPLIPRDHLMAQAARHLDHLPLLQPDDPSAALPALTAAEKTAAKQTTQQIADHD
jgi:hypothetical protein